MFNMKAEKIKTPTTEAYYLSFYDYWINQKTYPQSWWMSPLIKGVIDNYCDYSSMCLIRIRPYTLCIL